MHFHTRLTAQHLMNSWTYVNQLLLSSWEDNSDIRSGRAAVAEPGLTLKIGLLYSVFPRDMRLWTLLSHNLERIDHDPLYLTYAGN